MRRPAATAAFLAMVGATATGADEPAAVAGLGATADSIERAIAVSGAFCLAGQYDFFDMQRLMFRHGQAPREEDAALRAKLHDDIARLAALQSAWSADQIKDVVYLAARYRTYAWRRAKPEIDAGRDPDPLAAEVLRTFQSDCQDHQRALAIRAAKKKRDGE